MLKVVALLPDNHHSLPIHQKIPEAKWICSTIPFFSFTHRPDTQLCKPADVPLPLWKCADAHERSLWPEDMAFSALAAPLWPRFLPEWVCSDEEKCLISTPVQLTQLRLPVGSELGAPCSLGQCYWSRQPQSLWVRPAVQNPLWLSVKSHLSGEVTTASWLVLSHPPSLAALLNLPSSIGRSY